MRISDWSSDVCSSDLREAADARVPRQDTDVAQVARGTRQADERQGELSRRKIGGRTDRVPPVDVLSRLSAEGRRGVRGLPVLREGGQIGRAHSELQSLMRISYAVFCLKKQKKKNQYSHKIISTRIKYLEL